MKLFPSGHATHPQWRTAADLVLAQLRGQMAQPDYASAPSLGLLYVTDLFAEDGGRILDYLNESLPSVSNWSGTVGIGISAHNAEYFDEPAIAVMLCDLPADQYRVFSGLAPLPPVDAMGAPTEYQHAALVHADPSTHDLPDLVADLAARTTTGYLFGGLSSGRGATYQFAIGGQAARSAEDVERSSGVLSGGLSGVAFGESIRLVSRVTQGCHPISRERAITESEDNLLITLDGEPALDVLLSELGVSLDHPQEAIDAVRATLVGLASAGADGLRRTGDLGADVRVRHIIGLDPNRRAVAIADHPEAGMRMTFVRRDPQAARADLTRICAEIREELEPEEQSLEVATAMAAGEAEARMHPARRMAGAIYVSCSGRGGAHFGAPGAELQIVRHALGDVPLVGFFAGGEIARHHLYGYTGVLTVFASD
ncbi:FIST C-terminal domain-containing protein [Variovorax dokdonensis]|uniref:FIST C-terminal domain-containing protein n=1 Tax=Variovorax dokdonensis TaxID=344883 RepID=A0ABT7NGM1_9BURK|nr:FIST N-terminal domain-containing protein [Variovorax dokdonensis]MDM0046985.1 FIST C-terminal domain-containing protein [Variovorax dokdonensis]